MRALEGKVAIITGAGHGLGRAYAELFAREGAKIVANDLGVSALGNAENGSRAAETAKALVASGGEAVAHTGDCADWDSAKGLVDLAIERFGKLDVLVNNAGIVRDRMIFNMTPEDWDSVIRVHLRGHFCPTHHACVYWRERAKAGETVNGRVITTTSVSGIFGNAGQTNYSAAKAGILGFTLALSQEMSRYGVTVNCVAPGAQTRPEVAISGVPDEVRDLMGPEQVAPLVAYLASDRAAHVNGQVFNVVGGRVDRFDGWRLVDGVFKGESPWTVAELAEVFDSKVKGNNPPPPQAILLQAMRPIMTFAMEKKGVA